MEPATIAALASGAGSLLSGLGFGSKSSKPPAPAEQAAATLGYERDSFNQKMKLAKDHGLHPLAMMGIPVGSFSPVYSSGGESSFDPASIGRGVSQIASSFVKPPDQPAADPLEKRAAEANVRLLEAQAKRAEWDALGAEFRVADYAAPQLIMGQPGNPPGARISNDAVEMQRIAAEQAGLSPRLFSGGTAPITMRQEILPPHPRKLGYGAATDQAFVTAMGADGRPGTVLNQNTIQAEFEDGATMTLLTRIFGVDKAVEIMAALEQKGIIGGALLGAGALGKLGYDYFARQRADALSRQKQRMKFAPRFSRKYKVRKGGDQ